MVVTPPRLIRWIELVRNAVPKRRGPLWLGGTPIAGDSTAVSPSQNGQNASIFDGLSKDPHGGTRELRIFLGQSGLAPKTKLVMLLQNTILKSSV